jgi:hypothetical protein
MKSFDAAILESGLGGLPTEGDIDSELLAEIYKNKFNASLISQLKAGVRFSKLFCENEKIKNFLIKIYQNKICEVMMHTFTEERTYPKDVNKQVQRKLRNVVFS